MGGDLTAKQTARWLHALLALPGEPGAHGRDAKQTAVDLQHRHFVFFARVLNHAQRRGLMPTEPDRAAMLLDHFAKALAETNPNFDRDRFLLACLHGNY